MCSSSNKDTDGCCRSDTWQDQSGIRVKGHKCWWDPRAHVYMYIGVNLGIRSMIKVQPGSDLFLSLFLSSLPFFTIPLLFSPLFTSLQIPPSHSQIKCFKTTISLTHSQLLFHPSSTDTSPIPISFALLFSEHSAAESKRRKATAQSHASPHYPSLPNSSM